MTTDALFLTWAIRIALTLLCASFLLTALRVIMGPTLPDRIVGLDMLVAVAIGFIAVIGIKTGYSLYVDIAIALGLVGFLATVAFARFVLVHGSNGDRGEPGEGASAGEGDER
jgi:multicomponent Na+:H+ antiporter subunit F